jgi:Asp-tRNA(Asn)/Glu-tRNA(Gln) amidotransferase A subunit family amidase
VSPPVRAVVEDAARRFEAEGAHVVPVPPASTRAMVDGLDRFWRMRSWLDWRTLPPARQAAVLPYIRAWIAGAEGLSGEDVFRGFSQIGVLREAAGAALSGFDLLLSPVSPEAAFPATQASPLDDPSRPFEHIAFTLPWNMGEQPALSVPAGVDGRGLPIGLQIIGPRHEDLRVLRAARAWELMRGPLPAFPPGC